MTVWLVRHGHAGDRHDWDGDQDERPLSKKGRRQAEGLVEMFEGNSVSRIVSSRTTRCVQTVEPLATSRQLEVEISPYLYEGNRAERIIDFVEECLDGDVVLCSHGDVIPDLLWHLNGRGLTLSAPVLCEKGSVWAVDRLERGYSALYHAPAT